MIRVAEGDQNVDVKKSHEMDRRSDPLLFTQLIDERVRDHGASTRKTRQAVFIDDVDWLQGSRLLGGDPGEFTFQSARHEVFQGCIHLRGSDFSPSQKSIRQI